MLDKVCKKIRSNIQIFFFYGNDTWGFQGVSEKSKILLRTRKMQRMFNFCNPRVL